MKAEHVILTHFSQRYPKLPPIEDVSYAVAKLNLPSKLHIAFDLMQIHVSSGDTETTQQTLEFLKELGRETKTNTKH
jgi:hypothetical protein